MVEDKSLKVVGEYMVALRSSTNALDEKKISEVNLGNVAEVMLFASKGVEQKQIINQIDNAYRTIFFKIKAQFKTHLNKQSSDYIDKKIAVKKIKDEKTKQVIEVKGNLKFVTPSIYLKKIAANSNLDEGIKMITPSDSAVAYEFLMFRSISKDKAAKIQPGFVITLNQNGEKNYDGNDILKSFGYKDEYGNEVSSHNSFVEADGTQKKVPNQKAVNILRADKDECEAIIKNIFQEYSTECNILKNAADEYQIMICNSFTDFGSPDYTIDVLTCLETFKLAASPTFCTEPTYDSFEL